MRRVLTPRLLLLALAHCTIDAYSSFFSPLLPLLVQKLHLSLGLVGALVALASVASSFAQPLFGLLSDHMRRPWFIAFGPLVAALFMSSLGLAPSYGALVAVLMLGGIGVAAFHPQATALASGLLPRRGIAMAVFVTGGTIGFALGPLLAVAIVGSLGLEHTWIAAFPGLIVSAVLLFWFARTTSIRRRAERRPSLAGLRPLARPLALLYFAVVARSAVSYGFMTFLPIHLTRRGYSVTASGLIVSCYLLLGALGGFLGGWLADRWGGRRVVVSSFIGAAPLYFAFLFLPDGPGIAALIAGGFILQASLPVNVVMGQELSPQHSSTISSLLMGAAWGLGSLLIGPIGVLADAQGLHAALLALACVLAAGLVCALMLPDIRQRVLPADLAQPASGVASP